MKILKTDIPGVKHIIPKTFFDDRGLFYVSFEKQFYDSLHIRFVQENCSISKKNTIRGMHFSHQTKLVGVMAGKIMDVVVDLRKNSSSFKKIETFFLQENTPSFLLIPKGCAHGFCVLSETASVLYKMTEYYDPHKEKGFCWNDPEIQIPWPLSNPILSSRDKNSPLFSELKL